MKGELNLVLNQECIYDYVNHVYDLDKLMFRLHFHNKKYFVALFNFSWKKKYAHKGSS